MLDYKKAIEYRKPVQILELKDQQFARNIESESYVLGCMLLEPVCIPKALTYIKDEQVFYVPEHQKVFKAIKMLYTNNKQVDLITVTQFLGDNHLLDENLNAFYITQLTGNILSSFHIEQHCQIIVEIHLKRTIHKLGMLMVAWSTNQLDDVIELDEFLATIQQELDSINNYSFSKRVVNLYEVAHQQFTLLTQCQEEESNLTGIETGIPALNEITSGWQNTDLIVIGARPSIGKTVAGITFLLNAFKTKKQVAFFSLEMSKEQIAKRFFAMEAPVNNYKLKRKGQLETIDFDNMERSLNLLQSGNFWIDDTAGLSVHELRVKAKELKRRGCDLICIDYLQLLTCPEFRGQNREAEVAYISKNIKLIAKETDVPILLLAQLNRNSESRGDKKPQLADLRESGGVEQDADIVILLHRPERYGIESYEEQDTKDKIWFLCQKHRNGILGEVVAGFSGEYNLIYDLNRTEATPF